MGDGCFVVEGDSTFSSIDKKTVKSADFLNSAKHIVLDLKDVALVDSAGLALMIEWMRYSRQRRTQLHFKNVPEQLKHLAQLSGFDKTSHFIDLT